MRSVFSLIAPPSSGTTAPGGDGGESLREGRRGPILAPILDTKEISRYQLESLEKNGTFLRSSLNGI